MGTISTGVGLISGLDIEAIVNQLMQIEKRPREHLVTRLEDLSEQQTALMSLQARVLALQLSAASFKKESVFQQKAVNSSNEDVLTAIATRFAVPGNYSFSVKQLASSHHFVSRAYADIDSSIGSGSLSFEIGQGQLAKSTDLSLLNGGQGVQRGKIQITDRDGNSAEIDLTMALTVQDVIDEINRNSTVNVTASYSGDHLLITDNTAGSGNLIVADIGSARTAADLGIRANVAADKITGSDITYITTDTRLARLNDGNGIRGLGSGLSDIKFTLADGFTEIDVDLKAKLHETVGDDSKSTLLRALNSGSGVRTGTFRITDRNRRSVDINLDDLGPDATVGQLKTHIEEQAVAAGMIDDDGNSTIKVGFGGLDHIKITDISTPLGDADSTDRRSNFIIEDLDGGFAAADLGIVADTTGDTVQGDQVWFMESVGDVINAVNNHWDNKLGDLVLDINADRTGLTATDLSGFGDLKIESVNDSMAAEDLGLITPENATGTTHNGRRLLAGINTVLLRSLNGGSGGDPDDPDYGSNRITSGGVINLTDRDGNSVQLDLSSADTVQDVLDAFNNIDNSSNTTNIRARLNDVGNGIILTDSSTGTANMIVSGDLADKLNLSLDAALGSVDSGNLQLQYISETTLIDDLKQGLGINRGRISIVDGNGNSGSVNLALDHVNTVGDIIERFRLSGTGVRARINATGDGLELYDTSAGDNVSAFTITDENGSSAADLRLLGTSQKNENDEYVIDGSFEFTMDVGGGDTLEDIVERINDASLGLTASIINDGSGYRLSFNSEISGRTGNVYLDAGSTSLTTETISQGKDAILFVGDNANDHPLLIRNSTNTIENAVKGLTFELHSVSDTPVEITVDQDLDTIIAQMHNFVDSYNQIMRELDEVDRFDPNTLERGILFGDYSVTSIRRNLQSMVQRFVPDVSSSLGRLSHVGIAFAPFGSEKGTDGNGNSVSYAIATTPKLEFDEAKFRQVFGENPDAVAELFTKADVGIGDYINDQIENLAGTTDSSLKSRLDSMQASQSLFEKRIEYLDDRLLAKESSLYQQFFAMEQALASLQTQQNALASLGGMINPG